MKSIVIFKTYFQNVCLTFLSCFHSSTWNAKHQYLFWPFFHPPTGDLAFFFSDQMFAKIFLPVSFLSLDHIMFSNMCWNEKSSLSVHVSVHKCSFSHRYRSSFQLGCFKMDSEEKFKRQKVKIIPTNCLF